MIRFSKRTIVAVVISSIGLSFCRFISTGWAFLVIALVCLILVLLDLHDEGLL